MRKLLFLLLPFVSVCCATTKVSSFRNPDINLSEYKKIVVHGNSRDIDFQKTLESDLVNAFSEKNIQAVSSIKLMSPIKEYTVEEIQAIFSENEIDGHLYVAVVSAPDGAAYIAQMPQSTFPSQYANGKLSSSAYAAVSGGNAGAHPRASFDIILIDVKSGQIAFKATANSEGDEFSDMKNISKSLAKKIAEEYVSLSSAQE